MCRYVCRVCVGPVCVGRYVCRVCCRVCRYRVGIVVCVGMIVVCVSCVCV